MIVLRSRLGDHACIVVTVRARLTKWAKFEQNRPFGRMAVAIEEEAKCGKTVLRDAWRKEYVALRPQLPVHLQQFVHQNALQQSDAEQQQYVEAAIEAMNDPPQSQSSSVGRQCRTKSNRT